MKRLSFLLCAIFASGASAQSPSIAPNDGWVLRGVPPCRAVKFGATVDTQMIRARDGKMVVTVGHSDWPLSASSIPIKVGVSVDGSSPTSLDGYQLGRMVLVKIDTDEFQNTLNKAHTLHWHVPQGDFDADVAGLGATFKSLAICPG